MKKLILMLITLTLLLCGCGGESETSLTKEERDGVYTVEEMTDKYKAQGRSIVYPDKGIALLSTADSIEFNAECDGKVSVTLSAERMREDKNCELYFTAYVDGVRSNIRHKLTEGEYELILADDIESGEHNFRIVRQSEWEHGCAYLKSINCVGTLLKAPADKELFIEFVGDSIATGFGNLPEIEYDSDWGGHPVWEDGTQAFAYMTAQKLDADYSVVAIEGIGALCGYWDFTMNEIYENYPRVYEKDYVYTPERTADIVVVELFSNDSANYRDAGYKPQDIVNKGKELIEIVQKKHPDSKIVVLPGAFYKKFDMMINEELGGADNGLYCADVPLNTNGKSGHPDVEGHTAATEALCEVLKPIITEIKK